MDRVERMAGAALARLPKFTEYRLPDHDYIMQNNLKISCMGDSVTAGSYNYPNDAYVWVPNHLGIMVANDSSHTVHAEETNYFDTSSMALAATTYASGEFTLTSDGVETNPRFVGNYINVAAGEKYLISAEIENSSAVGYATFLRSSLHNASNTVLSGWNFDDTQALSNLGGYTLVGKVIDIDALLVTYPTLAKIRPGGGLLATPAGKVAKMRNFTVKKVSNYINVLNNGVSGEATAGGVARINDIVALSPNICVIGYGTNDIRQAVTLSTFLSNLATIVDTLQTNNIIPILATMPPLGTGQTNYNLVPKWNREIKYLAYAQGVQVWDRYWALGNGDLSYIEDERHPTKAGYIKLANNLYNLLTGEAYG